MVRFRSLQWFANLIVYSADYTRRQGSQWRVGNLLRDVAALDRGERIDGLLCGDKSQRRLARFCELGLWAVLHHCGRHDDVQALDATATKNWASFRILRERVSERLGQRRTWPVQAAMSGFGR